MQRRSLLTLAALATAFGRRAMADEAAGFQTDAFAVQRLDELLSTLRLPKPIPDAALQLDAPDLFEDGSIVPVTITCTAPGVRRVLLGVDRNPTWLAALTQPGERIGPRLSMRIKMQETSRVVALAQLRDGRVLMASKEVQITIGGCGGVAEPGATPTRSTPPEPTLIRLQPKPGGAQVRALFKHQMESGQRTDAAGRTVPAWHIEQVTARLDGQTVWQAQWGTAVSKNPFLQFDLAGIVPGNRLELSWIDNHGATRSDQAVMPAAG